MNQFEHSAFRREKIEEDNKIVVGVGVVVYDATEMAWALPGGFRTKSRETATRQAKIIDLLSTKSAGSPDVNRKGFRA